MCWIRDGEDFSYIIPNGEFLFKYIYPKALPEGQNEVPKGIFQDKALSCDWECYQKNPENSYHILEGKNVIIRIEVCDDIRNPRNPKREGEMVDAWHQTIKHDPVSEEDDPVHGENYSHALIAGKKKGAVIKALQENALIFKNLS